MTPVDRAAFTPIAGAVPFLKWAGGKRRLLKQYAPYFPDRRAIGRYYEPFIGSAAVFFHLQPVDACLSDVNRQLVEIYLVVQRDVEGLIQALQVHRNEHDYYYQVRALDPTTLTDVERAARLIFLNRTCYNGLYRENRRGQFNVPFGRYANPTICDEDRLRRASRALQGVDLVVDDFANVVDEAGPGDFVYFDPPYAPLSATSNFTSYNRHGFDHDDQRRLAEAIDNLTRRNVYVMLSNSSAPLIYELYDRPGLRLVPIQARRNINSKADGRGPVKELLILNYEPET
ncbi:MAG: DNA adenine methylase [Chloroflexota bacterium]|jgi:DNA adenine methylase